MAIKGKLKEGHAEIYKKDDMEVISSGHPKLNINDPPIHNDKNEEIYYLSSRVPIYDDQNQKVIGFMIQFIGKYQYERRK
jgi:hypothetical protein